MQPSGPNEVPTKTGAGGGGRVPEGEHGDPGAGRSGAAVHGRGVRGPVREQCTPSSLGRRLTLRPRDEHEALRQARTEQDTDTCKDRCETRAGVEGTISQGVQRCGLRRSRYQGLARTSLQHRLTGAAINLARIDAHLTGTPRARTRTRHLAALGPAEPKLSGAE